MNEETEDGKVRDEVRDERWDGEEGVLKDESGGLGGNIEGRHKSERQLSNELENKKETSTHDVLVVSSEVDSDGSSERLSVEDLRKGRESQLWL